MPVEAVNIASNSISNITCKKYDVLFNKFVNYGSKLGQNVIDFSFTSVLVIGFLLSIYTLKGSISSILMARAAIGFFLV